MRKTLLIGLLVVVVALGSIGAAFATGMGFSNVGVLSAGTALAPQANVDGMTWWVNQGYSGATVNNPWVDAVSLSFDRDLAAGTEIGVGVFDAGSNLKVNVWAETVSAVPAGGKVTVSFTTFAVGYGSPNNCTNYLFTTPPPDLTLGVPVTAVNYISVIVSEETAP
ncbi:MAG: hypothetical protein KJ624_08535 [Chloroflexi bacterium]|nr:hypothetical protein [Chloroflexota bacterium]